MKTMMNCSLSQSRNSPTLCRTLITNAHQNQDPSPTPSSYKRDLVNADILLHSLSVCHSFTIYHWINISFKQYFPSLESFHLSIISVADDDESFTITSTNEYSLEPGPSTQASHFFNRRCSEK